MEGTEAAEIVVGDIFTQAGETMTGVVGMSGNFFTALWAQPMGKIVDRKSVV